MLAVNNNYVQNNNRYNQSFKGIRKVTCDGLYKNHPELGKELVDTFKNNSRVMEFCRKYDVDIIFSAIDEGMNRVKSLIGIFYENPAKSKFKRFLDSFGNSDDKIVISGWGNKSELKRSLKEATADLKAKISPENCIAESSTGFLDVHVELADKKMQDILAKKASAKQKNLAKTIYKKQVRTVQTHDKSMLEDSVQDLMNKAKVNSAKY